MADFLYDITAVLSVVEEFIGRDGQAFVTVMSAGAKWKETAIFGPSRSR